MTLPLEDLEPETPSGDLVHWMRPGRLRLEPAGATAAAVGAFIVGAATAFACVALTRWLAPGRESLSPWKRARGAFR